MLVLGTARALQSPQEMQCGISLISFPTHALPRIHPQSGTQIPQLKAAMTTRFLFHSQFPLHCDKTRPASLPIRARGPHTHRERRTLQEGIN